MSDSKHILTISLDKITKVRRDYKSQTDVIKSDRKIPKRLDMIVIINNQLNHDILSLSLSFLSFLP